MKGPGTYSGMQRGSQIFHIPAQAQTLKPGPVGQPSTDGQVSEYMYLVQTAARRLIRSLPSYVDLSDLISAGYVGLIEAFQRFDVDRDVAFKTYALTRVNGAMLDSLRKLDWGSRDLRRRGRAVETAIARCTAVLGRVPEEDEIAQELGTSLSEFQNTLAELHRTTLGSVKSSDDENDIETVEFVVDPNEPGALVRCLRAELRALIAESLETLPERERSIIALYYYEELTDGEIAGLVKISPGRVTQLRTAAILRLRASLSEHSTARRKCF